MEAICNKRHIGESSLSRVPQAGRYLCYKAYDNVKMAALPSSSQLFLIRTVEYHRPSLHAFGKLQKASSVKLSPRALNLYDATQFWLPRELLCNSWSINLWTKIYSVHHPLRKAHNQSPHATWMVPAPLDLVATLPKIQKLFSLRAITATQAWPVLIKSAPAMFLMAFTLWGLGPCMQLIHKNLFLHEDRNWEKSRSCYIMTSYMRPLMLWMSIILICRNFDPLVLSSSTSQAVKERVMNFVRSLSTVFAFAFCTARLTQQIQKVVMERYGLKDGRRLGIQFIGNAIYSSVWIAGVCLFVELLGFSTQRWITAGGFGTVLVTLAGREIFTNFLSSIMIHATRPFVESEWIQTKIEGQEVSGTVEHVGWWSPTVIRGDDREAVHIPNHKFTVSVVRNLSQKAHWRIKVHLGISHLDFSKITYIVADMRKVLAKNPQVEHKRLHRRVFLDTIDPENQALQILVSCFVKTSHFEEYLRVKEIILLDLLKVISHHNARLATPMRTIQRLSDESEARNAPLRDPFLLVGSSGESNEVHMKEMRGGNVDKNSSDLEHVSSSVGNAETPQDLRIKSKPKEKAPVAAESTSKGTPALATNAGQGSKPQLEGLDSMGLHSNDITLLGAAFEKPPLKIPKGSLDSGPYLESPAAEKPSSKAIISEHKVQTRVRAETLEGSKGESTADVQEADRHMAKSSVDISSQEEHKLKHNIDEPHDDPWNTQPLPSTTRVSKPDNGRPYKGTVKENLVLGFAIDGPKRTLPLDEKISSPNDQKEFVASRNGNGNISKDKQGPPKTRG